MNEKASNLCGLAAIVVAVLQWSDAFGPVQAKPGLLSGDLFLPLFLASLLLPALAAWKGRKLWLLMLLSPVLLYAKALSF